MSNPIHLSSDAPKWLKRQYRKSGSARAVSRQTGINVRYIVEALTTGQPPANADIARALGFTQETIDSVALGDRRTRVLRWWLTKLRKHERYEIIESAYYITRAGRTK